MLIKDIPKKKIGPVLVKASSNINLHRNSWLLILSVWIWILLMNNDVDLKSNLKVKDLLKIIITPALYS